MIRKSAVAATLVASVSLISSTGASAAPVELTVRIEGEAQTLFEGPILTDGREVRADSETEAHRCDGTNGGGNPVPGATPTAASADAMELVGQSFDGLFSAGFDDFFITRWGPDAEDPEEEEFWGVLLNGVLTPVGGCQIRAEAGDEVLWAYDVFDGRTLLRLAAADDPSEAPAAPAPTARVEVGEPLDLTVEGYIGEEGEAPDVDPAAGVTVAPVQTDPGTGFQSVVTGDPTAVTSAADGSATVSFVEPGWHRLKAQDEEDHIRSNRLDVCVEPAGGGGCGPVPADAALRVPERYRPAKGSPPVPRATPTPPTPLPAASLTLGQVTVDARSGTATIRAIVSAHGAVGLTGRKVRARSADTGIAGEVKLKVVPTAAARESLRRTGRLQVGVQVVYTPDVGAATASRRTLTLRLGPLR